MARRANPALALIIVLAASACAPPGEELRAGSTLPPEWLAAGDAAGSAAKETRLVWVFRTADCLSCQSFDYAVRRLQAVYGDSLSLVAVHVGETARAQVPRSFFRARRIQVDRTVTLSPRQFEGRYGNTALPALLVVRGSTVAWSSTLPAGVANAAQLDSLVRQVRRHVPGSDGGGETAVAG